MRGRMSIKLLLLWPEQCLRCVIMRQKIACMARLSRALVQIITMLLGLVGLFLFFMTLWRRLPSTVIGFAVSRFIRMQTVITLLS